MEVVSVDDTMARVAEFWNTCVIAELNDQQVMIARLKGAFVMHIMSMRMRCSWCSVESFA